MDIETRGEADGLINSETTFVSRMIINVYMDPRIGSLDPGIANRFARPDVEDDPTERREYVTNCVDHIRPGSRGMFSRAGFVEVGFQYLPGFLFHGSAMVCGANFQLALRAFG